MNNRITLPTDLQSVIGSEVIDFSLFGKRKQPLSKSLSKIFIGVIWTGLTSFFVYIFYSPLLKGEEVHFNRYSGSK